MGRLVADLGDENATIEELDVLLTGCTTNGLLEASCMAALQACVLLRESAAAGGRLTDVAKDVVRNWSSMSIRHQRFVFALDMCQPSCKAVHIGARRKLKS